MNVFVRSMLIFALGVSLLSLACDDNFDIGGDDGNHPAYYGFESDPSLSLDRQWVLFAMNDTVNPANSGVYRASASTAIREQLISAVDAHSPTVLPDNQTVVFVQGGHLRQFQIGSQQILSLGTLDASFVAAASAQFVVSENNGNLVKVALSGEPYPFTAGRYPVGSAVDSITFLTQQGTVYSLWRAKVSSNESAKMVDLPAGFAIQWPSAQPGSSQVVFTVPVDHLFRILRYNSEPPKVDTLGLSRSARTCLLSDGAVLFTGEDGRLWRIGPYGGPASPWIDVED